MKILNGWRRLRYIFEFTGKGEGILRISMNTLLTVGEASEYLGVSPLTVYDWVSQRKITYIKVGRLVKFRQAHLDAWLDKHTVKARSNNGASATQG